MKYYVVYKALSKDGQVFTSSAQISINSHHFNHIDEIESTIKKRFDYERIKIINIIQM